MLNLVGLKKLQCFKVESEEERIKRERSREIDRELHAQKKHNKKIQKIVLLGTGESGKSTFFKQMQIIYGKGFTCDEFVSYRTLIYENTLHGVAGLCDFKRELKLPLSGCRIFASVTKAPPISPLEYDKHMKSVFGRIDEVFKRLLDERERENVRLDVMIEITPEQFAQDGLVDVIRQIWNDNSIREAYDRRREFPNHFVENLPYFIDNIDRIGSHVYL